MRKIGLVLTISLSLLAARAVAEEACAVVPCGPTACGSADCCARCGNACGCKKYTCQITCGMEKVKKYCWEVKCEPFCTLLPGRPCKDCNSCEAGQQPCQECQNAGKCGDKCPTLNINPPHCGNVRVKKTLVKKEYECERPKYKCVVQYLCPECAGCNSAAPAPAEGAKPNNAPAPAPQPKTTFSTPLPPVIGTAYLAR